MSGGKDNLLNSDPSKMDRKQVEQFIKDLAKETDLDAMQAALDLAGIIDPTPASDIASATMSLSRGDYFGASMSLISVIPYIGDAIGKTAKGARAAKKLKTIREKLKQARKRLEEIKNKPEDIKPKLDNVDKRYKNHGQEEIDCPKTKCPQSEKDLRTEEWHNFEWKEASSKDFKNLKDINMKNLDKDQQEAVKIFKAQGRDKDLQKQILNSGHNFKNRPLEAGDKLYGFTTKGFGKSQNSAYWLDEQGMRDIRSKFYKNNQWDKGGVKNYLALPCFNMANDIVEATVTKQHKAISSTVDTANEHLGYLSKNGIKVKIKNNIMPGGGTQITPNPNFIEKIKK